MSDDNTKTPKAKKKGIVRRSAGAAYSFLGFKDVIDGIGTQVQNASDTASRGKRIFEAYRAALTKKQAARVETYEEAVARLGLSETDLDARRRELAFTSYLFTFIFAGTFYFLISAVLNEELANAFTLLTICLTLGAVIFSTRFRVWQIETRQLGAPSKYIDSLLGRS